MSDWLQKNDWMRRSDWERQELIPERQGDVWCGQPKGRDLEARQMESCCTCVSAAHVWRRSSSELWSSPVVDARCSLADPPLPPVTVSNHRYRPPATKVDCQHSMRTYVSHTTVVLPCVVLVLVDWFAHLSSVVSTRRLPMFPRNHYQSINQFYWRKGKKPLTSSQK